MVYYFFLVAVSRSRNLVYLLTARCKGLYLSGFEVHQYQILPIPIHKSAFSYNKFACVCRNCKAFHVFFIHCQDSKRSERTFTELVEL